MRIQTVLALTLMSCAPSVRPGRTHFDQGRVVSATMLGTRGEGHIVWLEHLAPAGGVIRHLSLQDRRARTLARTSKVVTDGWIAQARSAYGWSDALPLRSVEGRFEIDGALLIQIEAPAAFDLSPTHTILGRQADSEVPLGEIAASRKAKIGPLYLVGTHAIIAVRDTRSASLEIVDLDEARVALDNVEAIRALRAGDTDRAAELLERAIRLDPSSGESIYNLACVHAVTGDLDRAEAELAIALALENRRFTALARKDPDLALLRERPSVRARIGLDPD